MRARSVACGAALAAAAVLAWTEAHVAARAEQPKGQKIIYVSVVDDAGKPVKDMTADEFALREDGKDRQIVSVGPAQAPLSVVVLVDTDNAAQRKTQDLHSASMAFIKQLHSVRSDAEVELMEFGQAPVPATSFITGDVQLESALSKMVPKIGADSVLMEAIAQANNDLAKRPSGRRAILALAVEPSNEQLGDRKRITQSFEKSSAQLWSLSVQQNDITYKTSASNNTGGSSAAANANNVSSSRDALLLELAKASGGMQQYIASQAAMASILSQWADALTYQYQITYVRDANSAKVVQVGVTRQGVHTHASGFAPQ
jgi:VWFA-related protein